MANNYTQYKKEINGVTYTAQFNTLRETLRAKKAYCDSRGNVDTELLADYLFKNVIVDPPGLTIEHFDDLDELNAVTLFATQVLHNRFRQSEPDEGTVETGSKK